MTRDRPTTGWLRRVRRDNGRPLYLALLDALEAAIREGELQPGDQLPPQRAVAGQLGVDFTTVTRTYGAARERGLIEGAVGRGTFVRRWAVEDEAGLVDLSMNLPPPPQGLSLAALLKETTAAILDRTDVATLMAYHAGPGTPGQRAAGAAWLEPSLGAVEPERIVVCPGAQSALAAVLTTIARPGAFIVVEPLTYPGLIALAQRLNLSLAACPVDDQGFLPEALAKICAERGPVAVYLTPTTRNPVATTMGLGRRHDVARIVGDSAAWLLEDDPYGRLFDTPLPALTSLIPDRAFHIATLSKTLSPGLRTAFLATPPGGMAQQIAAGLHAMALMGSPLTTAVAVRWIREGSAERLLAGVRAEARARRALATELLPGALGAPEGIHVWLDLPPGWDPSRLRSLAAARGLSLVTADAFATTPNHPSGLRISLGGPAKAAVLREALGNVAALLIEVPATQMIAGTTKTPEPEGAGARSNQGGYR